MRNAECGLETGDWKMENGKGRPRVENGLPGQGLESPFPFPLSFTIPE